MARFTKQRQRLKLQRLRNITNKDLAERVYKLFREYSIFRLEDGKGFFCDQLGLTIDTYVSMKLTVREVQDEFGNG